MPAPTMIWKAAWVTGTLGHWSRGMRSRPITSVSRLLPARKLSAPGISIANDVSRRSTSGQPPIVSGARRCVSNCASAAASLAGW